MTYANYYKQCGSYYFCIADDSLYAYGKAVEIGDMPIVIGERINPTGKSKFKQALKEHNIEYILKTRRIRLGLIALGTGINPLVL